MNKNFQTNLLSNLENPRKSNKDIINHLKRIKNILEDLNIKTLLDVACKNSRIEVIEYLFRRGIDQEKLIFNNYILYNPKLLQIFINIMSTKTVKNLRNEDNETLLLKYSMYMKSQPCFKILVKYCDLDAVNVYNYSFIYYAYYTIDCLTTLRTLFKRGASIKAVSRKTMTPIKYFCRKPELTLKNKFLALKLVIDFEPAIIAESRESNSKFGVDLKEQQKRTGMDYLMKKYSTLSKNKNRKDSKEGKFLIFFIAYLKQKGNKAKSLKKQ